VKKDGTLVVVPQRRGRFGGHLGGYEKTPLAVVHETYPSINGLKSIARSRKEGGQPKGESCSKKLLANGENVETKVRKTQMLKETCL